MPPKMEYEDAVHILQCCGSRVLPCGKNLMRISVFTNSENQIQSMVDIDQNMMGMVKYNAYCINQRIIIPNNMSMMHYNVNLNSYEFIFP